MTTQLEHVRPGPPTPLTSAEQRAFYADQGYLVFPDLLTSTELADLRAALADVLRVDANELAWCNRLAQTDRDGSWAASTVEEPKPRALSRRSLNERCDEEAEPSKPEMARFGLRGSAKQMIHGGILVSG